ncbi:hypothetical protein NDU88_002457 [Pleurodeles waltl]|uniref:Phosphatidylinositol-glycan biosynthesis class X protein n=2 Tax=Pleurodeles waltl TaxID=8319 RepID=A0AAV7LCI8_PLEWA|nr:hypothetical protein NDU88_002457 [Pleurodeles waltl]
MFFFCLTSHSISGIWAICPEVTVTREIFNEGFHRDLVSRVKFIGLSEHVDNCKVMFQEKVPSGLYVDPYQLSSLQEHNITEAIITDMVDVEAPEYLSTEHAAYIFAKPDLLTCAKCFRADIPVHFRYHQPSLEDGEASVTLQGPQLLIRCSPGRTLEECWEYSKVDAPCAANDGIICRWNNIKYRAVPEELTLHVPVGLHQHSSVICALTLLVTLSCSVMILVAVYGRAGLHI